MSNVSENFQQILKSTDEHTDEVIDQEKLIEEFKKVVPEDYSLTTEEQAEGLAFSFADRFTKAEDGNYFGSKITMSRDDGSVYEIPSIAEVQPEMIEYWGKRAATVQHPYLIARYAGLAWDLSLPVTGQKPVHALRKRFIQSSLDIVKSRLFTYPMVGVLWLKRALEVASTFNDNEYFEAIKELALTFEKELHEQEKPGTWGFAYDLLFNNKRIILSKEEEEIIITRLEQKLSQYSQPDANGKTDPWACEHAVNRLAEYYTKKNSPDEVKRVVMAIGQAYEPLFETSSALQVSGWMQKLHQLYLYYRLNQEAEELLKRLRDISAKAAQEMQGVQQRIDISKEEADAMVESFYSNGEQNSFEQIVIRFIPDKDDAKETLHKLAKEAPLHFSLAIQLTDQKGRVVANVGALENDEDGHILLRISEHLTFTALFLHLVFEKGQENGQFHKKSILDFLSNSAVINSQRVPILDKALDYYFSQDYIGFLHVCIPQIEEAMRNLVEFSGGKTLKYKDGVYQLRTFDDVLRDASVNAICGDNMQLYYRILFTDPRGWNLRNEICHGLSEFELFRKQTADRVLHALLTLGIIRKEGPSK